MFDTFFRTHAPVLKALVFGAASKMWGAVNIPVQLLLIAFFFTPELQGYFYTFQGLLGLQAFVELGLSMIIVNFTSHEWSALHLNAKGEITGPEQPRQRLFQFGHLVFKFYAIAGSILVLLLIGAGLFVFSKQMQESIHWLCPWLTFSVAAGLNLFLIAVLALLEGANQVNHTYLIRFGQSVALGLTTWFGIASGLQLWTCPLALLLSNVWTLCFLFFKYPQFFKPFFKRPQSSFLSWKKEVLPLQKKLAISVLAGYFAFSLFNPLALYFQGPLFAGQLGMTLAITQALTSLSTMWLNVYTPQFGSLIAQKKRMDLLTLFKQTLQLTTVTVCICTCLAWLAIHFLHFLGLPLLNRMFPFPVLEIFLIGNILFTLSLPYSAYMRAHKQEPLMLLSVCYAASIALATYCTIRFFSALALSGALFFINVASLYGVKKIWIKFEKQVFT